ncbi:MAG TPA: hypothetical protein VGH28_25440 [Polyangiaceae bacterium]|jgi:hypothetical protein
MKIRGRSKLLVALACVSMTGALVVQACGGDDSKPGDAGPDGTSNDAVANDAPVSDDGGCPTYTGSSPICKASVARCNACNPTVTACERSTFVSTCEAVTPFFSAAYINATADCATLCDSDAQAACSKASLADASVTAAQLKIATDYCGFCDGGAACISQVESSFNLVEYSDSLAATIDSKCAPDAAAKCPLPTFGGCVVGTLFATLPPNPCADAGGD